MPDLVPTWYAKKRMLLSDSYEIRTRTFDNLTLSESYGNNEFVSIPFQTTLSNWWYSKTIISSKDNSKYIEFVRNYGNFPHFWVKTHPKKRKYLVCAEDTHSISVIDLKVYKMHTWMFDDDFWPRSFHVSPNGVKLAIYGSVFGSLDEIRFYDFSNPSSFPLPQIGKFEGIFRLDSTLSYLNKMVAWSKNSEVFSVTDSNNIKFDIYGDGVYETSQETV